MDKRRWTTLLLLLLLMALPALAQGGGSREITGIVVDELDEPLIGATVTNVRNRGDRETFTAITDVNGHFKLTLSRDVRQIEVNYIVFQSQVIDLTSSDSYRIQLVADSKLIDEVVVTGVFERKANTYTGAVTTVKGEELQRVGNVNVLQSLKNIDPSFMQIENLAAGSNPNSLPDFQMRGASTIASVQGEYASGSLFSATSIKTRCFSKKWSQIFDYRFFCVTLSGQMTNNY